MTCIKIRISSNLPSNSDDVSGVWYKDDVEFEMSDIDCKPNSNTDWIEWVLDHDFDCALDQSLIETIKNNKVTEISFYYGKVLVTVSKTFMNTDI